MRPSPRYSCLEASPAVSPPSMTNSDPVQYDDSSLARYTTHQARDLLGLADAVQGHVVGRLGAGGHEAADHPGADGAAAHPVAPQVQGDGLGAPGPPAAMYPGIPS